MNLINAITADPRQTMSIVIQGYDNAQFSLEYKPNQFSWYFDLTWQSFTLRSMRITATSNMLRQWRNVLPFGLVCLNDYGIDPTTLEAFTSDSQIFLLSAAEVAQIEAEVYGQ